MKQFAKYIFALAAFAAISVSCAKELVEGSKEVPQESVDYVNITVNAGNAGTKTFIDGTSVKWGSGELLEIFQDKDGTVSHKTSDEGETTDSGATMSFDVAFATETGTAFTYYAFYPAASYSANTGVNVKINTPANQTPTATSFDPAADLLIAQKVENGSSQATTLDMAFTRAVAVGKMTLTNLASSEYVKKVIFSAKDGSTPIEVAGRTEFSLATAKPTSSYANNVSETSIILDYSALSLQANSSMEVFFTCYPFEITAGDSFTVEVQTATKSFTRTVTLTGAQQIIFAPGSASRFSVNMSTAAEENIAVNLPYACLTAAEYNAAGGAGSYGNVTVSKPHGDKWETYAMYTSSSIQIRNSDTPGSFVKLPSFTENIKTVNVTLSAAIAAGKKLTLETTSDGTEGSILSLTTVADQTSYSFDLTSKTVKTAYLRSVGAAAKVSKIEVLAGEDTRAAKAPAPASIEAALNGSDPNTIDVTWTAASGAAGYIVTLTPTAGDAVVKNAAANATSISFDALPSSTTFTPTIVTVADPYLHKANSDSQAGSDVATGVPATTTIAAIKAKTSGSEVAFSAMLTDALVTLVSGNQFYMEDASGAIWVNTSGHGMSVGDKISGSISGTVRKTSNNYQITGFVSSSATKTTGNTVTPTVVNAVTLASSFADYESKYVKVNNVKVSGVSGKNLTLDGIDGWIVYNDSDFNITQNSRINAVGIACYYSSTKEVKLFTVAEEDKLEIKSAIVASDKDVLVAETTSIGATKNTPASITYESDDESIATVNSSGVITGVAAGSTTITMTTAATGVYSAAEKVINVTVSAGGAGVYTVISSREDITAGTYLMGSNNNNTFASSTTIYLWSGSVSSNKLSKAGDSTWNTSTKDFSSISGAATVTLENGSASNKWKIKVGTKYLAVSGTTFSLQDDAFEWTFNNLSGTKDGIYFTNSDGSTRVFSNASGDTARAYTSGTYKGIHFFKAN